MGITQDKTLRILKKLFNEHPPMCVRFIKIHGGRYQEAGLPDILILTANKNFWLEIKRDWSDKPSSLQTWNITTLRQYGFITGYVVGDEYKLNWDDLPQKLPNILK